MGVYSRCPAAGTRHSHPDLLLIPSSFSKSWRARSSSASSGHARKFASAPGLTPPCLSSRVSEIFISADIRDDPLLQIWLLARRCTHCCNATGSPRASRKKMDDSDVRKAPSM